MKPKNEKRLVSKPRSGRITEAARSETRSVELRSADARVGRNQAPNVARRLGMTDQGQPGAPSPANPGQDEYVAALRRGQAKALRELLTRAAELEIHRHDDESWLINHAEVITLLTRLHNAASSTITCTYCALPAIGIVSNASEYPTCGNHGHSVELYRLNQLNQEAP